MTKKLEDLLQLPESAFISARESNVGPGDDIHKQRPEEILSGVTPAENLYKDYREIDKIEIALPRVVGLGDASDSELDELAKRATDAYDDLMDLGMNVEARYSSRIFEVAATMLKNAIDAKSAKIDKKLKMVDLQIKKRKVDQEETTGDTSSDVIAGESVIVTDRNSLLEKMKNMK